MPTQVVFVHGVANRDSSKWRRAETQRDGLFRQLVFGASANVVNPYWGELGANPAGGEWRSLPDYDNDGDDAVERLSVTSAPTAQTTSLAELAADNFADTVDSVFAEVFDEHAEREVALPDDVVEFAMKAAAYAEANPSPNWLRPDLSDDEFLKRLERVVERHVVTADAQEEESLGLFSWLKNGGKRLTDKVRNAGGRFALARTREGMHDKIAQFVGDIFVYLRDDAQREPIRSVIREPIKAALASGDPVVLIGHSMGGVILTDCLGDESYCRSVGLGGPEDKKVDALITVGSQPGFFLELGLLSMTPPAGGSNPSLAAVKTWINVLDELDVLSFRASTLFDGVDDYLFSSGVGAAEAHGAYFKRNQFYHRVRKRLGDAGLPVVAGPA